MVSVHNFPPMPWHTIDGLFFSSITLFLMARVVRIKENSSLFLIFAGVASVFAALAKQSFYFLPILLIIIVERPLSLF